MISNTRLYGSAIALVSGVYSLFRATTGMDVSAAAWFMLALGVVVIVHGVVLLTPLAERLGSTSGPLMVGYSVLMLVNQALLATGRMGASGMNGGMGGMGTAGMAWDPGMVAIAVLMLASGVIMTVRPGMLAGQAASRDGMA